MALALPGKENAMLQDDVFLSIRRYTMSRKVGSLNDSKQNALVGWSPCLVTSHAELPPNLSSACTCSGERKMLVRRARWL